ncbi:hypothetical protein MLD38_001333 [Melastoma candidum]|uniref:Uncharacterized protein n=1 Tax=Melastoma candidum TaxID=119954 RepID=A0ACB9SD02_9MYRT|nr:hypothetical protein MLD38_001333 [Melastoma candidum]
MNRRGGASLACAACKHQRRKCVPGCFFFKYFPADQPQVFRNALRLFGVRNMLNLMKGVPLQLRDEAMASVIYESNMRALYPVHGTCVVIRHLYRREQQLAEELVKVQTLIASLKEKALKLPDIVNFSSSSHLSRQNVETNLSSDMIFVPLVNFDATCFANSPIPYMKMANSLKSDEFI